MFNSLQIDATTSEMYHDFGPTIATAPCSTISQTESKAKEKNKSNWLAFRSNWCECHAYRLVRLWNHPLMRFFWLSAPNGTAYWMHFDVKSQFQTHPKSLDRPHRKMHLFNQNEKRNESVHTAITIQIATQFFDHNFIYKQLSLL